MMCTVDEEQQSLLKNIQQPIQSVFDENLKAASVVTGLDQPVQSLIKKINTIIKSPFYIREFLGIISRQQRDNLSTELKAKGDTGIQKNDKLKFVWTFVLIIALYKSLYLESSITTKNSLHCGEILSLNSHKKRKKKKCMNIPALNISSLIA